MIKGLVVNPPQFRAHRTLIRLLTTAPFILGFGYIQYRKYMVIDQGHREINDNDCRFIKNMRGKIIDTENNPGLRLRENFLRSEWMDDILLDCRSLLKMNGSDYIPEHMYDSYQNQLKDLSPYTEVNTCRVSGKPQQGSAKCAPWQYGFNLDKSKVPRSIKNIATEIQNSKDFRVGELTDVTIERREKGFLSYGSSCIPIKR
eukprot:UN29713